MFSIVLSDVLKPPVGSTSILLGTFHFVAGSIPGKKVIVIDQKTEEVLWSVPTDDGVRPMTFDTNADGSTKRIFVQLSNFNGFITIDFATHKVVDKIKLPDVGAEKVTEGLQGAPAHGLALASVSYPE